MDATTWRGATALVTGASRGLGRVIAEGLAREGMALILVARDASQLEETRAACEAAGAQARALPCDLGQEASRRALVEAAGPIDVLVNNAGVEVPVALLDQRDEDVDRQVTTNLLAPIDLTRRFLPGLKGRPRAAIVNVSSMSGKSPTPFNAIYAATKFGLNGFTASLRIELEGTSVTTGVVCPSFVGGTGMWADTGLKAPLLMKEVPPQRLVSAVLRVMNGAHEVLVTPSPVRPLLALGTLFPGLDGPVLKWMGVRSTLEARARRLAARGG